jgi:HD-GYP domain-containing protein (c-di-GMP phosphodiesterase class II)
VVVGLLPLGIVAWKLIDGNREFLTTAERGYQLLLVRSIASQVDVHVEALRGQLVQVAQALGAGLRRHGPELPREEIRRILAGVMDERLVHLRFTDLQRHTVDSRSVGAMPESVSREFDESLLRAAELVAQNPGRASEEAYLSAPLLVGTPVSRVVLVGSVPVVSGRSFHGVVSALVDLQWVWDSMVENAETGRTIFALDRQGRLFASNDARLRPGEPLTASALVKRFLDSRGRARETLPFVLEAGGRREPYIGSYDMTLEGWGVFVQAPEKKVYLRVQEMVNSTMYWALIALAFAVLVSIILASTLSTPIKRLADASRAFAAGEFSVRVQVRNRNEIGDLADTFNRMAGKIEEQIRDLKELFLGTIRAVTKAIDAKDRYTRGHSERVRKYSVIIARQLGLPESEVEDIDVSSVLHDVGKIAIPDAVLSKPGDLTPDEFEKMKKHPEKGAEIMEAIQIQQMQRVLPGLRNHHERWDGAGYPDGLSGEDIPLMARIIAVADTFDAMTTNRPYQRTYTFDEAAARINELQGERFDPRVVEAFNRAYRAGEFAPDPGPTEAVEVAARAG